MPYAIYEVTDKGSLMCPDQAAVLSEDDLSTIRIALGHCGKMCREWWDEADHGGKHTNIYDRTLDILKSTSKVQKTPVTKDNPEEPLTPQASYAPEEP